MEYSAVPCGPLFFPATHSAALFVSPRRLFFSVNELLLQFLCMYLFFPPLCPEPSSAEPPLSTFTLFSWCSTGLPSLFFLSWFNLKSELCSPLYLISSLPVSPLSRSVLSLSVGVQRLMNAKDSFLRPECGDSPKGPRAREMCVTLPLCEIWC